MLFDNGLGFSAKHRGGTSKVERAPAARGIAPITSSVNHPQTCGKNERVHQTMAKWLAKHPTPSTIEELQALLERYRHVYNNRRHQSLGGRTPQQSYDQNPCATAPSEPIILTGTTRRAVSSTGVVQFDACDISLGRRWSDTRATLHWRGDLLDIVQLTFDDATSKTALHRIRSIDHNVAQDISIHINI